MINRIYFVFFLVLLQSLITGCPEIRKETKKINKISPQTFFLASDCSQEKSLWGYANRCNCEDQSYFYDKRIGVCLKNKKFYQEKKLKGFFKTGIFSIGGETTGHILESKDDSYDLYLKLSDKKKAQSFHQKEIIITGSYFIIKGTERNNRKALIVKEISFDPN